MMLQWQECKKNAKGALLLFRLGDFYETFEEDAVTLSKELDIVLTKRQETPMAGIPAHACDNYLDRLLAKGYRVAIAEQMEDPKATKGLVKRAIVRTITPGTVINSNLLSDKTSNFLAAITQVNTIFGLAILDVTTADFRVLECENETELLDELSRLQPKELLISQKCAKNLSQIFTCSKEIREEWHFDHQTSTERLLSHFRVHSLDSFGLKGMIAAINAAGALLAYVKDDLNLSLDHVRALHPRTLSSYMSIDRATQRHLELTEPLHDKGVTLLDILDQTITPMGARLLKEWLLHPLLSVSTINARYDLIDTFLRHPEETLVLSHSLKEIRDIERLIMRIETGFASPRDLVGLRFSLEPLPKISTILSSLGMETLPDLSLITSKIRDALVEAPPLRLSEGGIFKSEYHAPLDELRALKSDSQAWVLTYQARLRELTQIKTLKVGYTHAFGYYIEVSRGQSEKMPPEFQRKQTLINAERFTSQELKEFEHKILSAESMILSLENELFFSLRQEITGYRDTICKAAKIIACTDVILSLAKVARDSHYTRPLLDESDHFMITDGRHPVIEASLQGETFIPNNLLLDEQKNRLLIITGPNMAGKSTYIRQVALIAIMAQMGSFVPASKVSLGIIDKVFTRIGASDDLSRGQSTFMVEMSETAHILHNATSKSLVILDEIGRGTSTYDGIAIAWAVAEHLLCTKKAKTLFATHYWELTRLAAEYIGAVNFNIAVHESPNGIVFLHKIVAGGTDKSYGIHVAKLAGLPFSVIKQAETMLLKLHSPVKVKNPLPKQELQLELF
ncbi:MAG: DNA mismatch repair protein MutS [Rhabdochlamydiaceae bacterium]